MYKTLIVADDEVFEFLKDYVSDVLIFSEYLKEYPKLNEPKVRLINLCDVKDYLSTGYYCSLLAEARKHTVLPSVKTINSLRNDMQDEEKIQLKKSYTTNLTPDVHLQELMIFFGRIETLELQKLADFFFNQYPAPILKLKLFFEYGQYSVQISSCSFASLNEKDKTRFGQYLMSHIQSGKKVGTKRKQYRWNMAILVNPDEELPPSNKEAIIRFVKAAGKLGILAEPISIDEIRNLNEYDALFIRETTAIDHHTYRLACKAEANDLVVLDDPTSILRCCNKVFLHDAFTYSKVPSLRTEIVADASLASLEDIESTFEYPLILKMPEGAFSKYIYKITSREMLKEKLEFLLQQTALVLVQEYMYTEYDWRIGILNGRPIYACRYYMAHNHWKIYNHESKRFFSGKFDTLATFETPKIVLDAAIRACRLIGSGLYGVDIKLVDKAAYVLEVNDNPSIDHKIEDDYLGDELYMLIASDFLRRLEARGK